MFVVSLVGGLWSMVHGLWDDFFFYLSRCSFSCCWFWLMVCCCKCVCACRVGLAERVECASQHDNPDDHVHHVNDVDHFNDAIDQHAVHCRARVHGGHDI